MANYLLKMAGNPKGSFIGSFSNNISVTANRPFCIIHSGINVKE